MLVSLKKFDKTILNNSDLLYINENFVAEKDRNAFIKSFQIIAPDIPQPKLNIQNPILLNHFDYVGDNSVFSINPPVLHFKGFAQNCVYEKHVEIINKSNKIQKLHIVDPQTEYFTLQYQKDEKIVPGAVISLNVKFLSNEIRYYYDSIKLHCQNLRNITIPIHAYQAASINNFPTLIDFKAVPVGDMKKKVYSLECEAQIDFEFKISYIQPHRCFTVEPLIGVIPIGNKVDITICYMPVEYATVSMKFQIDICQFFSKPIVCTVTGYSRPGMKKELLVRNELELIKSRSKTLNPLSIQPTSKIKIRKIKSAEVSRKVNVNACKESSAVITNVPKDIRLVRSTNEFPCYNCSFDLLSVNIWNKKNALLWRFKQAARKVIIKNRLLKVLDKLKKIDNLEQPTDPNVDFDRIEIDYFKENIDSKLFPLYKPALKKDLLDSLTSKEYSVSMSHNFKENLPYSPLKICKQYKVLGYKQLTSIGSLTSLVKTRKLKTSNQYNANNSNFKFKRFDDDEETDKVVPIQMPNNLYDCIQYPPGFVHNPEPIKTFRSWMPWSEFDQDFCMNPLPQFVCAHTDSPVCAPQKKFLNGEEFIEGTMQWRKFNSSSLNVGTCLPTFLDVCAPPKCSYEAVDVSSLIQQGLHDEDLKFITAQNK